MQSLRTPVTSCENLATAFYEANVYPKHNDSSLQNSNSLHILPRPPRVEPSSSQSNMNLCCICCCCSHFCRSHISLLICLGLILLFIFNMTLYSFIFYQAHIEGHDWR